MVEIKNCKKTWNIILLRILKFCYFLKKNLSSGKSIFNKGCLATKTWYIKYQDFIKTEKILCHLCLFFLFSSISCVKKKKGNRNQMSNISNIELEKIHHVYHYRIDFNAWLQFISLVILITLNPLISRIMIYIYSKSYLIVLLHVISNR